MQVSTEGGSILVAEESVFPVSENMSGAFVRIHPGGIRQMHWHLNFNEWQYVINGTLEGGVYGGPGKVAQGTLAAGDVGYAPRGSGHYLLNTGADSIRLYWPSCKHCASKFGRNVHSAHQHCLTSKHCNR